MKIIWFKGGKKGMNKKYDFSFIITAYNVETFLEKCVDGILKQLDDKFNFEIIISDNMSKDKTREIANRLVSTHSNIRVITSKPQGPSAARNRGIEVALGKYIVFIDADDYIDENICSVFENVLRNDDVDLFQCAIKIHTKDKKTNTEELFKNFKTEKMNSKEFISNLPLVNCFNGCYLKIVRKDFIVQNELWFDEKYFLSEDMQWSIKVWNKANKIMAIPTAYYNYIIYNAGSITNSIKFDKAMQGLNASKDTFDWLDKNVEDDAVVKKCKKYVTFGTCSVLRKCKNMTAQEIKEINKFLKQNKNLLKFAPALKCKLFLMVRNLFGLKFALKFV